MNTDRIKAAKSTLEDAGYTVDHGPHWDWLQLRDVTYPDGWAPRQAPLLIRYPDQFPRIQPAVCIPRDLQYLHGPFRHRTPSSLDGWTRVCIHKLTWDPSTHGTKTILELAWTVLRYPDKRQPIRFADDTDHPAP